KEYIFKHALLRDVAYESVLKKARLKLHAQAADWLVAQSGARVGEYARLIADHYEQAGEARKAAEFLERAGAQALRISAYQEAKESFERALGQLPAKSEPADAALRVAVIRQLGEAQTGLGAYADARGCYELSLSLARELKDVKGMAEANNSLSYVAFAAGDYDSACRRAEESMELSRGLGDQAGLAEGLFRLGLGLSGRGELAEGKKAAEEALAIFVKLDDHSAMSRSYNTLGNIAADMKAYDEAKAHYRQAMTYAKETGNRFMVGAALNNLGLIDFQLGERDEARRLYQESLVIFQEIGIKRGITSCLDSLGELEFGLGHLEESRRAYADALKLALEIGGLSYVAGAIAGLALIRLKSGGDDGALDWIGLVLAHPAAAVDVKARAESAVPELRTRLGDAAVDAALKRGAALVLDDVAKAILSGAAAKA